MLDGVRIRLAPVSRQGGQFLDAVDRVIGDPFQHISQVGKGLHPMPFAGADQRINNRCAPATSVTAEK